MKEITGNYTKEVLPNGLTLLAISQPQSAVVTADIWVRSGARTEPERYQGVSHFLEHLVFKGSERLLPGQFDHLVEERGGTTNAATSMDFTHYYITVAREDLAECLPLLAEIVCTPAIPDAEFDPERLVVLEEIRRANDNPDRRIYQTLVRTLYGDHPYSRPVLGEPANLMDLTPALVRAFHRERYRPEAMTVVLAGGLSADQLLAAGRETFQHSTNPELVSPLPLVAPPGPVLPGRHVYPIPRLQQHRLLIGWLGPDIRALADGVALEFVSTLLTTGRTSRLVRILREEKGWARNLNSYFSLQHDPGLFVIGAQVEPQFLEPVEHVIREEVQRLTHGDFTLSELERARRLLISEFVFGTETPSQTCTLHGYYSTVADLDQLSQYRALLDTLEAADIQQAAQRYLGGDPTTLIFEPQ
ncbi:M16 family metallopeptidase [Anthocerotibacter panamensis]|uniref:M16 family metallopeptidase n=1 Tax=Anthocerotibacter panamensis TaxID=2857077 RepID=UPI001C40321D|nr:pitrilysin family protein [Anthocerotibacter panamensis]